MAEKHIISQFMPGMNIDLVPTEREPGASDFMINMESLPGRGLAIRRPFTGYIQPDGVGGFVTTGGSKVHSWCMFDGALWFVVDHTDATAQSVSSKIYRVLNGAVENASTAGLITHDVSLTRSFDTPWKMVSTGDSIVLTSGTAFFDGDEELLAPFYVLRKAGESGSTYRAFSASIIDRQVYGHGISVSVVPYVDTGLHPDCYKPGYETYWDNSLLQFSAEIEEVSWVRVILTATVGDSEVLLYDKTLDLRISSLQEGGSRFGSARALRIYIPSDVLVPTDTTRIRYYRSIGKISLGLDAPRLVAEWLSPLKLSVGEMGHSIAGTGLAYNAADDETYHALSGGVNLFYTCEPKDYQGLAMSRGMPSPFCLWPSSSYQDKWDDWPTSGTGIKDQKGSESLGMFPLAGLLPVVGWWRNEERASFTDPWGIATLGRYAGYMTDPRWRGMMKPVYDAGDAMTKAVWHIGSKTQEGCLLWTGQPCFLTATLVGGKFDVGVHGGTEEKTWSPVWLFDRVTSSALQTPDFAGLDTGSPQAIYGISQGTMGDRWKTDKREVPYAAQKQLNYWWSNPFGTTISSADLGTLTAYINDAAVVTPWAYGSQACGFGRLAAALLAHDSSTKDRPIYGAMTFGISWNSMDDEFSMGPVGRMAMALPMIPTPARNKTGNRLTYVYVKQNMPQAISYRYEQDIPSWVGFRGVESDVGEGGFGCYQYFGPGIVSYRLMLNSADNNETGARVKCKAILASRTGNDLYVELTFTGATGNGASGWTPPTYASVVATLEGPWINDRQDEDVAIVVTNPITITYLSFDNEVPCIVVGLKIENALPADPALLAIGQGNRLRVEIPFTAGGTDHTWGALFEPSMIVETGDDSTQTDMPYIAIWKGADIQGGANRAVGPSNGLQEEEAIR